MPLITVLCYLALCATPMLAQTTIKQPPTAHVRFERINTANGLSNNEITCIFQDRDGFMWFGTADGLNKYDGNTITVYRSDDAHPWTSIPSNQINAVTQDEAGNIWVGTKSGVAILDRQTHVWKRFPRGVKDSLGKPVAYNAANINADKRGNIWIAQRGEAFFRFNTKSGRSTAYLDRRKNIPTIKRLKPDYIKEMDFFVSDDLLCNGAEEFDMYVYVCNTVECKIMRYDREKDDFVLAVSNYAPSRRNALADDGEYLWFGCELEIPNKKGIQQKLVRANKRTGIVETMPSIGTPFATCVVGDEVWFGVFNGGIKRVSRTTKQLVGAYTHNPTDAESLPSNMVTALYRDRTGCIWSGTGESGIAKLAPSRTTTLTQNFLDTASLPSSIVQAVCEDSSGTLWVGTRKGLCGIERGTGKGVTYQRQHPIQPIHINDIVALCLEHSAAHPERNKHLWVASWGMGVQLFDIAERRFPLPPQPIQSAASNFPVTGWSNTIVQFAPDSLMFNNWGTHLWTLDLSHPEAINTFIPLKGYVSQLDNSSYKQGMKLYQVPVTNLYNIITQDREGTLWAGGEFRSTLDACGLFRRKKGENWTLIAKSNKNDTTALPTDIIHAIYESTRGDLWLGTADGLCLFDRKTLKVRRFSLPNNVVMAIQEDAHGHLWCGTAKGLVEFDPAKEVVVRVLRPVDGLPSWSFNRGASMKSRLTGELFFGTNEGLCWFHPDSLRQADVKPLVAFTKYAITRENGTDSTLAVLAGTAHFADGIIELSHRDKGFSFEMAALDFKSPADNEYAYKLDGFDKDWNSAGNRRFASYTSLPDGEYTLRIKAANADGVWNEAATTLRIRVRPPFWRTWWFYALSAIVSIGAVVGVTRFVSARRFVRELAQERERLEAAQALDMARLEKEREVERERLESELALERERGRISQDLHDELGPGMTKILMLAGVAETAPESLNPHEITTTAQEVMKAMAGVIWLAKPENDTMLNLIAYLREYADNYCGNVGINVVFDVPRTIGAIPILGEVRRSIFLVIKESLNNVAKHARASEVRITLALHLSRAVFTVADNGQGFNPLEERPARFMGGNGIGNMRRRIEHIGGKFTLESVLGQGTTTTIEIAYSAPNPHYD